MRANRCRIFCLQTDLSTNKAIFKPMLKNCMDCEYFKKRLGDKELNKFIEAQKTKGEDNGEPRK